MGKKGATKAARTAKRRPGTATAPEPAPEPEPNSGNGVMALPDVVHMAIQARLHKSERLAVAAAARGLVLVYGSDWSRTWWHAHTICPSLDRAAFPGALRRLQALRALYVPDSSMIPVAVAAIGDGCCPQIKELALSRDQNQRVPLETAAQLATALEAGALPALEDPCLQYSWEPGSFKRLFAALATARTPIGPSIC